MTISAHAPGLAHSAAFLGPRGENAGELEQLILDVLRDHVFWRRNFHPEDPRLIREDEKTDPAFVHTRARLRDELFEILAGLKRGAPLYSPRQVAHIVSDPSLPGMVGYFAGMLYNQNNVVQEVAPETVCREREYVAALARMVRYPELLGEIVPEPDRADGALATAGPSWGHLCSGGTTANMEALWIARNVRLFPLALRLFVTSRPHFAGLGELELAVGTERVSFSGLSTAQLWNLSVDSVLALHQAVKRWLAMRGGAGGPAAQPSSLAREFEEKLRTAQRIGLAGFLTEYNKAFTGDQFEQLPVVLVPVTSHYGWKKAMDLVGLGSEALLQTGVDNRIRLSLHALREKLEEKGQNVLMVASVCGTTEEAAVDPLHELHDLRQDPGLPRFWHHCDAALGGFFATLVARDRDGEPLPFEEQGERFPLEEEVFRAICSLRNADSMALDPHKFGYVPYPCGAVLFRSHAARDFIAYEAPYLAGDRRDGFRGFLGMWTLEGSRSGAAAVSCYLSQAVIPLTRDGHGELIANCVRATQALFRRLADIFEHDPRSRLRFCPFNHPDTTGFCFALVPRNDALSLAELNAFTLAVWETMTVDEKTFNVGGYAFLISKSDVNVNDYIPVLQRMLDDTLSELQDGSAKSVTLLRVFVLNPLLSAWIERPVEPGQTPFDVAFAKHVFDAAHRLLPPFLLERFVSRPDRAMRRLRVAVVEDETADASSITRTICFGDSYSRYLESKSFPSADKIRAMDPREWDKVVLDLQLHPGRELDLSGLFVARQLIETARLSPGQLVVFSRFAGIPQVREELAELGLNPDQMIEKPRGGDIAALKEALHRLLEQLVTGILTNGRAG
ncbi:MAG TPA: pyridoxal-dependent decarboxylase [Longimicrobium sp.]